MKTTLEQKGTKRTKGFTPRRLKRLAMPLGRVWRELREGAKVDLELNALSEKVYALYRELYQLGCQRETEAAERKDRREGNPVMFTLFCPDSILGMQVVTRTAHRLIQERKPTLSDLLGIALFEGKKGMDRYQPEATAAVLPWLEDLDIRWHSSYETEERRLAQMGKRVDEVLAAWTGRFERARREEAQREAAWTTDHADDTDY